MLACVSEILVYKRRPDLEIDDAELLPLEICCNNNKVLVIVAYRTNEQEHLWDSLQECCNKALATGLSHIIITGDLNADPSTVNGEILKLFVEITILQNT